MRPDALSDQAGTLFFCVLLILIGAALLLARGQFGPTREAQPDPTESFRALAEASELRHPDWPRLPVWLRWMVLARRPTVEVGASSVTVGAFFVVMGLLLLGFVIWKGLPHPALQRALEAAVQQPSPPGQDLDTVLSQFLRPRRAQRGYEVRDVTFVPDWESSGCDPSYPACAAQGPEREVVIFQGRLVWTEQWTGGGNSQHKSCSLSLARTLAGGWKLLGDGDCLAKT